MTLRDVHQELPGLLKTRYDIAGVTPPTPEQERALADLWRKIRVTSAQLPDATKEPQSWLHELGPRLAAYMRKLGIINNGEINRIRDLVKASVESNKRIGDEDFAFDILKMQLANRQEVREFMATKKTEAKPKFSVVSPKVQEGLMHDERVNKLIKAIDVLRIDLNVAHMPGEVHIGWNVLTWERFKCENIDEVVDLETYDQQAIIDTMREVITTYRRTHEPEKITSAEADKLMDLAASVSPDEPKSDKLDDWFPHCPSCNDALVDGKCTNPACPALFAKDDWTEFWISAKHLLARIDIPEKGVHQWVHAFYKIDEKKDSLKNLGKAKNDILTEIRKEVDATLAQWEEDDIESHRLVTKIRNADKPAETPTVKTETHTPPSHDEPVALPVEPTPPVGVYSPEPKSTLRPVEAPPLNGTENGAKPAPKYTVPLAIQTLNGVPMHMIRRELDKPLPPQAYQEIKGGSMKGKTDLDIERIRDRFDQVFGPQGLGWAIETIGGESQLVTSSEPRKAKDKQGNEYDQTWYVVDLVNYRLRYTMVMPDNSLKDCYGTAMSDSGDNMDRGYALEGAMSSLIKQAYRRMGGMNHIYYGEYTHVQARKDMNAA